ncbi:hypothetical protein Hanom_Chr07g00615101 [Helianthus anomalus]
MVLLIFFGLLDWFNISKLLFALGILWQWLNRNRRCVFLRTLTNVSKLYIYDLF